MEVPLYMEFSAVRTDLALEESERRGGGIDGVSEQTSDEQGFHLTRVSVLDERGAESLCKPIGEYITLEFTPLLRREENSFEICAGILARELRSLLGELPEGACVLAAGLGNEYITPDAIGPWAMDSVLVTRHLTSLPEFASFRPVAAVRSGVLGTTGVESAQLIAMLCRELSPAAVIAVDALASLSTERLCRTVQLSDAGIVPGSGVGNAREALSRETLGVPVIAVGVPTVVDATAIAAELASAAGVEVEPKALPQTGLIVTPRDIDRLARDAAKLVGYSIDLALHPGLTAADIDMLIS